MFIKDDSGETDEGCPDEKRRGQIIGINDGLTLTRSTELRNDQTECCGIKVGDGVHEEHMYQLAVKSAARR